MNRPTQENKVKWKDLAEDCKAELLTLYPDIPEECYVNWYIYYENGGWWLMAADIAYSGPN